MLKWIFKFEWEGVKRIVLSQGGDNKIVCEHVINIWFQKWGSNFFTIWENKLSMDSALYYSVHKYIYIDPLCPDHQILRYCSCKTYLLRRRTELKAGQGSAWWLRKWTLGKNIIYNFLHNSPPIFYRVVRKQEAPIFEGERFNVRKVNELDIRKQYQIENTNRFAALGTLSVDEDINRTWENIKENIKSSAKQSLCLHLLLQHKTWFDEECLDFF